MQNRLKGPAIALIVTAILALPLHVLAILRPTDPDAVQRQAERLGMDPAKLEHFARLGEAAGRGLVFLGILLALFVALGAWKMLRLESWRLCVAASICALLPCWYGCCLGIPIGVWALVLLLKPEVRASFAGEPPPAPPAA